MNCKVTCRISRLELCLTNKLYRRQRWNSSALVNLLSRPVGGRAGKCNLIHFIAHFSCDCWLSGWLKNPYPVSRCCGLADSSLTGLNGNSTVFDMSHDSPKNTMSLKAFHAENPTNYSNRFIRIYFFSRHKNPPRSPAPEWSSKP